MKKKFYFLILGIAVIALLFFALSRAPTTGFTALNNFKGEVTFYKSLTCGCCEVHASYLSSKGKLNVNEIGMQEDISTIKRKYNIPRELESCHTAIIDNYFVEGHMPLEAINKLLEESPDIAGIALPGMPEGSPGMPGSKKGDFVIYAVKKDGTYSEFMRI